MYTLDQIKSLINNTPKEFEGKNVREFNSLCVGKFFNGNISNICSVYKIMNKNGNIHVVTNRGDILTHVEQIPTKRTELSIDTVKDEIKIIEKKMEEQWEEENKGKKKKHTLTSFKEKEWGKKFVQVELGVKKSSKIYKLLDMRIENADFCEDTKRYCRDNRINYIGQLVKLDANSMVLHWAYLLNKELKRLGLSLNTNVSGWQYPISKQQRKNFAIPISEVNFPVRFKNSIKYFEEFVTLKDIATCPKKEFWFPNCGAVVMEEVTKVLAQYGLELGMEDQ